MSPYAIPIIVVPRKSKHGATLAETETSYRLLRIEQAHFQSTDCSSEIER